MHYSPWPGASILYSHMLSTQSRIASRSRAHVRKEAYGLSYTQPGGSNPGPSAVVRGGGRHPPSLPAPTNPPPGPIAAASSPTTSTLRSCPLSRQFLRREPQQAPHLITPTQTPTSTFELRRLQPGSGTGRRPSDLSAALPRSRPHFGGRLCGIGAQMEHPSTRAPTAGGGTCFHCC